MANTKISALSNIAPAAIIKGTKIPAVLPGAGTTQEINYEDFATQVYEQLAHLNCSGVGTEISPFIDTAGAASTSTGGLSAAYSALGTRGGKIRFIGGRYDLTATAGFTFAVSHISLVGDNMGWDDDPNGEHVGTGGTILRITDQGLTFTAVTRPWGVYISGIGFGGTGLTTGSGAHKTAIYGSSFANFLIERCSFAALGHAVKFAGTIDSPYLVLCEIQGCGVGFENSSGDFYGTVWGNVIADNDQNAVIAGTKGVCVSNNLIVRCLRVGTYTSNGAVLLNGAECVVSGNQITYSGTTLGGGTVASCDGIYITAGADRASINGNTLANNSGYGIRIKANKCVVAGNNFNSNTSGDILVDTGATDNVIVQPNAAVTDNGTRTIINGASKNAGDPDSTGNWNGVSKPDGLVIVDNTNHNAYLYHAGLSGGRKLL